ncbi:uncharacterized protein V6R79_024883 [Siganus canaliculatus]
MKTLFSQCSCSHTHSHTHTHTSDKSKQQTKDPVRPASARHIQSVCPCGLHGVSSTASTGHTESGLEPPQVRWTPLRRRSGGDSGTPAVPCVCRSMIQFSVRALTLV